MRRFMTMCLLTAFLVNGAPVSAKDGRERAPGPNSVEKRAAKVERIADKRDARADKLKAKALQRARRRPARPVGITGVTAPMRFRGLDRDHDGVITRDEWRGNSVSFRVHDWNRDGLLAGREVRP